jgi:hypothetical protein
MIKKKWRLIYLGFILAGFFLPSLSDGKELKSELAPQKNFKKARQVEKKIDLLLEKDFTDEQIKKYASEIREKITSKKLKKLVRKLKKIKLQLERDLKKAKKLEKKMVQISKKLRSLPQHKRKKYQKQAKAVLTRGKLLFKRNRQLVIKAKKIYLKGKAFYFRLKELTSFSSPLKEKIIFAHRRLCRFNQSIKKIFKEMKKIHQKFSALSAEIASP